MIVCFILSYNTYNVLLYRALSIYQI